MAMKKINSILTCAFLCWQSFCLLGQVSVNSAPADNAAILSIDDNRRGFLPTRLSSLSRINMKNLSGFAPIPHGLVVYDTDDQMYYYYNPTNSVNGDENWQALSPFLFKDKQNDFDAVNNLYRRDIETHKTTKNLYVFNNSTTSVERRLAVYGRISISTDNTLANTDYGLYVGESSAFGGNVSINGALTADKIEGPGMVPIGGIIMWAGNSATIPTGFTLCNGSNGSPDLSNKFIAGHSGGGGFTAGYQNTSANNTVKITKEQMPVHKHDFSGSITSTTNGAHRHLEGQHAEAGFGTSSNVPPYESGGDRNTGRDDDTVARYFTSSENDHTHAVSFTGQTEKTGKTTGAIMSYDNRPVYYVLAYIMRYQ